MEPSVNTLTSQFPTLARELDEAALAALGRAFTPVRLHAGDEIVRQGSRQPALYFLTDGDFALRLGDEQSPAELGYLPPGALVGEISFFDDGPATATVMMVSRSGAALRLDTGSFERLAEESAKAAAAVCQVVCETLAARLRIANERYDRMIVGVPPHAAPAPGGIVDLLRTLFGLGRLP